MSENSTQSTEDLIAELIKRGASMEQVAQVKDSNANDPIQALELLKDGNSRFYSGQPQSHGVAANARRSQIMAQTPFAVILGCADSRVPVEIVFDQGPGNLFSIRVAGNVAEAATLGSIQYAVKHLKVRLIVVLGHEGCGAVAAAMLPSEKRDAEALHVRFLLDLIEPAVRDIPTIHDGKARMREAVAANIKLQRQEVAKDPVVAAAIAEGQVQVVGAFYEIGSGAVDFLDN